MRIYHGQGIVLHLPQGQEKDKREKSSSLSLEDLWFGKEDNMETLKREQTAQGHQWEAPKESQGQEESGDKAHLCLWGTSKEEKVFH